MGTYPPYQAYTSFQGNTIKTNSNNLWKDTILAELLTYLLKLNGNKHQTYLKKQKHNDTDNTFKLEKLKK